MSDEKIRLVLTEKQLQFLLESGYELDKDDYYISLPIRIDPDSRGEGEE